MLVLCPECEVSAFFVGGDEEGSVSQAMRFLGCLVICVHEGQMSEVFLDTSTKCKFPECF